MATSGISVSSPIASAVLPNEDQLELIRKGENSTRLLRWTGGRASKCREFQFGRRRFFPAAIDEGLPSEITLATGVSEYESATDLFNRIAHIFQSICALEQNNAEMATFFVFATHFVECRDPGPRAIVTGIDTWEISQFLQLLRRLCRARHPGSSVRTC